MLRLCWVWGRLLTCMLVIAFLQWRSLQASITITKTNAVEVTAANLPVVDDVSRSMHNLESLESTQTMVQTQQSKLTFPENSLEPLSIVSLEIPIDANSSIAADISKIWHNAENGSICVHLKENARCPRPSLLGRLSGPALAILDWKEHTTAAEHGTLLCGDYSNKWLDIGEYFVEIIILYCEDFGVGAMERIDNETAWLEAGFSTMCVEDSMHNRITAKEGSKVIISSPREGKGSYRLGRWVRRPGIPLRPLFTRHQPLGCCNPSNAYRPLTPLPEWCEQLTRRDKPGNQTRGLWKFRIGTEISGLPEYEFQWRINISEIDLVERLRKRLQDKSKNFPKICAVGDSHSRLMEERSLPQLNLHGLLEFVQHYWISPNKIAPKILNRKCDKVFIQIGQWPASWYTKGNPTSFAKYHRKMKQHVENVLKVLEKNPNAKIYIPTTDQGPLSGRANACNDWRIPTVLDGYSMVSQIIERELNTSRVEYIDTSFIISTHWDGHPDWTHLLEDVRYRKTIYISAMILGELDGLGAGL